MEFVRDNMPFGRVGTGEFGTYFIGYCRTPRVTEQMTENMFVGRPPDNYDRLLQPRGDRSPVLRTIRDIPVESVNDTAAAAAMPAAGSTLEPAPSTAPALDGSLGVGSLKGENRYE